MPHAIADHREDGVDLQAATTCATAFASPVDIMASWDRRVACRKRYAQFRKSSDSQSRLGTMLGDTLAGERPVPGGVPAMRVLIIEDDAKVAGAIKAGLIGEGWDAIVSRTGEDGYFRATTEPFDVLVLDLMLPGRGGLEILAELRKRGFGLPIIVLTARDAIEDRVLGLDAGADDYLVKPFAFAELLARLRALVRRGRPEETRRIRLADLEIDPIARTARRADRPVDLTTREFELLEYLLRHQGQIVSREMLARDVWKEPSRGTPLDNVIDVHITRLRKKIDQDVGTRLIHTIRGVGFLAREGEP